MEQDPTEPELNSFEKAQEVVRGAAQSIDEEMVRTGGVNNWYDCLVGKIYATQLYLDDATYLGLISPEQETAYLEKLFEFGAQVRASQHQHPEQHYRPDEKTQQRLLKQFDVFAPPEPEEPDNPS